MKVARILAIILGAFMIVGGVYCLILPEATYLSLAWVIGVIMVADGIADIATWIRIKQFGLSNGWLLAGAILSIACGIFIVLSAAAQLVVDLFIAYMVAIWLIITGVIRMVFAWRVRKARQEFGLVTLGRNWWIPFVLGILLVVLGVLGCVNPTIVMVGIGILLGVSIIMTGMSVLALAL